VRVAQPVQECLRSSEAKTNPKAASGSKTGEDGLIARLVLLDGERTAYELRSSS
jgi:hypothetical protein